MTIRAVDPEAVAAELAALWNRSAGTAFPLDERLLRQQVALDTDPRLCLAVARPDGSLVAASLVKRAVRPGADGVAPRIGYLSLLAVDEAERRRGLAAGLLTRSVAWLASRGAERLELGGDYYHLVPGRPVEDGAGFEALDAFLRAVGFEGEGFEYDLSADLTRAAWLSEPERLPNGSYRYALYEPKYRGALLRFIGSSFPGRWSHEIREALDAGIRGADLMLAVDERDGSVVGFSRIYDKDSPLLGPGVYWRALMGEHPGGLGPIGVDPSRRGLGLGMGLLEHCVRDLARRGVGTMVIDWTDLVDFYGKLGFKVWKRYERMSLRIRLER
ncbi:MAG TPA: GNAT family N-acetyltransferase [Spirochaetales bacterium]|nr:GNAT family N-acetyltransferase [Spirochaetales bacterium]